MKLQFQSGEKPLWSQLYDILEARIMNGEYKEGEILPSEKALMDEFEISRITVRQAMDKLINAKLICRKRGKGTIVLKKGDMVATSFEASFNGVEEKNNVKDRRVISVEYVTPTIEVAYFFGISINKPVLKLTRQTYMDGCVVTHYETYINPMVPVDDQTDFSGSMYHKLEQAGFPVTSVREKITASVITNKEKELFKTNKTEAIMNRTRMGSSDNMPVEYTYSKYVAKGYELVIDFK